MSSYITSVFKTKLGYFELISRGKYINKCYPSNKKVVKRNPIKLHSNLFGDIDKYFKKELKNFDYICEPKGTTFQLKVWREIANIEYGKTKSYLDIAKKLNSSPRAIGNACSKNLCLMLIPCHRVICSSGDYGGFITAGTNHSDEINSLV